MPITGIALTLTGLTALVFVCSLLLGLMLMLNRNMQGKQTIMRSMGGLFDITLYLVAGVIGGTILVVVLVGLIG